MCLPDLLERVVDANNADVDRLAELGHDAVDGGEEEILLAGEVAIQRPLADAERIRKNLQVGFGIAVLGKESDRRLQDLLAASGTAVRVCGRPTFRAEGVEFIKGLL